MRPDPSLLIVPQVEVPTSRIRHITVIYNIVKDLPFGEKEDLLADADTIKTAHEVAEALQTEGFGVNLFELNEETAKQVLDLKTDLIFNLAYGIGSISKTEAEVIKILEKSGIPYTGGTSSSIKLTDDKIATKKKFLQNNIPTPAFQIAVSQNFSSDPKLHFPLIVKPSNQDCSLGIHGDAVVVNEKEAKARVTHLLKIYKEPVLLEEYIDGRELNITLIGNGENIKMLPVSEIVFGKSFNEYKKWKIVDFEAKCIEDSIDYKETVGVCPAVLEKDILKNIEKLATLAYQACHCRDYARIDIRLSKDNTPYFLEINLNPGIGLTDGAIRSAKAAGFTYSSFLKELVRIAIAR